MKRGFNMSMRAVSEEKLQSHNELINRLEKLVIGLDPKEHNLMETVHYMNLVRFKMIELYHNANHQPEILAQINKLDSIINYVLEMHTKHNATSMR
jgi:hypothetical protein